MKIYIKNQVINDGKGIPRSRAVDHVIQILSDELIVFRTLIGAADQVLAKCGTTASDFEGCIHDTIRGYDLSQWGDVILGEL